MNQFDELFYAKNNELESRKNEREQTVQQKKGLEKELEENKNSLAEIEELIAYYEEYLPIIHDYKKFMRTKKRKHLKGIIAFVLGNCLFSLVIIAIFMPFLLNSGTIVITGIFAAILVIGMYFTSHPKGIEEVISIHNQFSFEGLTNFLQNKQLQKQQILKRNKKIDIELSKLKEAIRDLDENIYTLEQAIGFVTEQKNIVLASLEPEINQRFNQNEQLILMREKKEGKK